jgi:ABC-type polysaccharide/polyol phosphate export permease
MSSSESIPLEHPTLLRTIRRHRTLLVEIVRAQFRLRDQSTILGYGWSFLNPLLMLGFLYLFFSQRLGRGIEHYGVYLLIALVHFAHFSNSTSTAMTVLASMSRLTCDTIFPKELLVVGAVISSSIEFAFSLLIALGIAAVAGVTIGPTVALLPVILLLQLTTVLWLSLLLATAYVFAKDLGHIYQVFLRILFFVTPTFYAADFLGQGPARYVVLLNPLAHLIDFSRGAILEQRGLELPVVAALLVCNAAASFVALAIFRRHEPLFAERL